MCRLICDVWFSKFLLQVEEGHHNVRSTFSHPTHHLFPSSLVSWLLRLVLQVLSGGEEHHNVRRQFQREKKKKKARGERLKGWWCMTIRRRGRSTKVGYVVWFSKFLIQRTRNTMTYGTFFPSSFSPLWLWILQKIHVWDETARNILPPSKAGHEWPRLISSTGHDVEWYFEGSKAHVSGETDRNILR